MQDKVQKVDFEKIAELVSPSHRSRFEAFINLLGKGLEGGGIGFNIGGISFVIVAGILAIYGIAVASFAVMLAASLGAGIFGILAIAITGYQIYKAQREVVATTKKIRDERMRLQLELVALTVNFALLESEIKQWQESKELLNIDQIEKDSKRFESEKAKLVTRFVKALSFLEGETSEEKLKNLFANNKPALENFVAIIAKEKEIRATKNNPLPGADFKLQPSPENSPKSAAFKTALTALGVVGGFGLGFGLTIGIGTMITLGTIGAAAVFTIGWPILAPALVLGALFAVGAYFYDKKIKARQEAVTKSLQETTAELTAASEYLGKENKEFIHDLNAIKQHIETEQKEKQVARKDQSFSALLGLQATQLDNLDIDLVQRKANLRSVQVLDGTKQDNQSFGIEELQSKLREIRKIIAIIKNSNEDTPGLQNDIRILEKRISEMEVNLGNPADKQLKQSSVNPYGSTGGGPNQFFSEHNEHKQKVTKKAGETKTSHKDLDRINTIDDPLSPSKNGGK